MKHADITIMTNSGGRLGHYGVDPTRYGGLPGSWPKSSWLLRLVVGWLERHRQRRTLRQLDDRMLRDVGLTRFDAEHEIAKPFWRP